MSLSLSASHVHLSLTGVITGSQFYYCTTIDSVIVHKPAGSGIGVYAHPGIPNIVQDSVLITSATQGYWLWDDGTVVEFYVYFVSISPTDSWTITDTTKCTESSVTLWGQTINQPDFTYLWSTGVTTPYANVSTPGIYAVTVTGVCGMANDQIEVLNYPIPNPDLGPDVIACDGNTVTLDPGIFSSYLWNTGATTPTINVTISGSVSVVVTDTNGCHKSDTIAVTFDINNGEEILIVTIDTTNGYNKVMWDTLGVTDVTTIIYREVSTNVYTQVGTAPYFDGEWTDTVNSTNQTWRYKITTIDTCGNESPQSLYHQTISTATVPLVPSGYRVEWTEYLIEGGKGGETKSVSNYYVFAVNGLGGNWLPNQIAMVSGYVTNYNLPAINDSMFVVGADLGAKSLTNGLALSNVVDNPMISGISNIVATGQIPIYPNPSSGDFTVTGEGILSVYNVIGECVLTGTIHGKTMFHLNSGIYMVKITKQNTTLIQKVIIH